MIPFSTSLSHYNAFKREVESLPGIQKVATSQYKPYQANNVSSTMPRGLDKPIMLPVMTVDRDYVAVSGLAWSQRLAPSGAMYEHNNSRLNETAITNFGLQGSRLGRTMNVYD